MHDSVQLTPLFAESPETVAASCVMALATNMLELATTATLIAEVVTVAVFDTELLVTDVALRVTVRTPAGGAAGAV
jgi:hypothetical protein